MCDRYVGPFSTACACKHGAESGDWAWTRLCTANETLRSQLVALFLLASLCFYCVLSYSCFFHKRPRRCLLLFLLPMPATSSLALLAAGAYRLAPHYLSDLYPRRLLLLHSQARILILIAHISFILFTVVFVWLRRRQRQRRDTEPETELVEQIEEE